MAGKTGIDAIFLAIHHICLVLNKYDTKARALIHAAESAGVISSAQETTALAFLDAAQVACEIFQVLATFNSVS